MKERPLKRISLAFLLGLILVVGSSCVYVGGCDGWGNRVKYERQEELVAPLEPGGSFSAETRDGSITLEGTQTTECRLMATIRVHAATEEKAQELAEQIQVTLEPTPGGLRLVVEKPSGIRNASYGVSLTGTLPTQTSLTLVTSDGSVRLAHIEGAVDARTSDGSIRVEDIKGDTRLKTSDGRIECTQVEAGTLDVYTSDGGIKLEAVITTSAAARTSDGGITLNDVRAETLDLKTSDGTIRCHGLVVSRLNCRTSDGSVHIEYTPDAPNVIDAVVSTSDGSITFAAPSGLSAVVEASTSDGSIRTSLPLMVEGKVGKSLRGTAGDGKGKVTLKTHDGSITIK